MSITAENGQVVWRIGPDGVEGRLMGGAPGPYALVPLEEP